MALHAHNTDRSHRGAFQPQWQQPTYEPNLSGSSVNHAAKTSQSIPSRHNSESQNLEREHSIAVPTLNEQSHYESSSQSVPVKSGSGPMATAPFLKDFNLVAEAARRAQMAVMMREMESVKL